MSKIPHKLVFSHKEGSSSSLIEESNLKENNNNNYNFISRQRCRKSKTIRNENPDILINQNESIKQSQKLLQGRKSKKRMTQLEKNLDLPDTLLGLNEYKEFKFQKDSHILRKLRTSCLNPDLPDVLEPIEEIITSNMSKPYEVKEEKEEKKIEILESHFERLKKLEEMKNEIEEEKKKLIIKKKKFGRKKKIR